jgi:hypothetical protein
MRIFKIILPLFVLFGTSANSQIAQQNNGADGQSAFTRTGKLDYEYYLWRFSDNLSDLPYSGRNEDAAKNLLILCENGAPSSSQKEYPLWAKDGFGEICNFAKDFHSIIVKDKKPMGRRHCTAIRNAAIAFERGVNSAEWAETKNKSDNFLRTIKRTYELEFTHSWTGGWYGAQSYRYSCQ